MSNETISKEIEVKAGSVQYLEFGDPAAKEAVVCLHASATAAATLTPLGNRLGDRRRVLVPNLDGYGASKIDCAKCPATFRHVQAVERFLRALAVDDIHLVGHSMGGLIALRVARRARFRLKSLVLIEPMAFGMLDADADARAIAFDREMIDDFLSAIEQGQLEEGLSVFTERVSDQKWSDLPERAREGLLQALPQIVAEAPLVSCDDLSVRDVVDISAPVLLIDTENGPLPAAPIIRRIADAIPDARTETLAGVGHMAPVTDPALIDGALSRFYASLSA